MSDSGIEESTSAPRPDRTLSIGYLTSQQAMKWSVAKDLVVIAPWTMGSKTNIRLQAIHDPDPNRCDQLFDEVVILISNKKIMMARLGLHGQEDGVDLARHFQRVADDELDWKGRVKGFLLSPWDPDTDSRVLVPLRDEGIKRCFREWGDKKGFHWYGELEGPRDESKPFRLHEVFWPTYNPPARISVVSNELALRLKKEKYNAGSTDLDDGYPVVVKEYWKFRIRDDGKDTAMWIID